MLKGLKFIIAGLLFGIIMVKSEAVSWFRIFKMFQLDSFHMYGIIGTSVLSGILVVQIIKRLGLKDISGSPITFTPKQKSFYRYSIGGLIFGLGWAMSGACPGPMFTLLGGGVYTMLIVIGGALLGTLVYGLMRHKLPH